MRALLSALALLVSGVMIGLVGSLTVKGAGSLTPGWAASILPAAVATVWLAAGALGLALPLGVGTALYLVEYARPGPLVRAVRSLTETLAGVPSILFGLFGFALFVVRLGWGPSLLSASATLALMLLPTVVRTSEEALAAVPQALREGAAALGASRWDAIRRVVLPQAAPGIATGALLALGRAVGETAAVLLTAGVGMTLPRSPLDSSRPLAVHLFLLAGEGSADGRAHATALALVVGTLLFNALADLVLRRRRAS
ncbi:phosphate transport system permease protein [Symbiobacterium terraclitae]|uniref:Phosphate transport system permease protein PstA n=1 Tax=Symbiobacterium terraclitae TaxID=557451 RepID=A0ABS4JX16_9FIRM|nr:phosphate ABC transporter permease PstA [Symbiobacterium terraclitae]MBP2020064.1 phosphate transport system permease protein [Symbiobacterium terraclitae]